MPAELLLCLQNYFCLSNSARAVLLAAVYFQQHYFWGRNVFPDLRVNILRAEGKHQSFVQVNRIDKNGRSLHSKGT